MYPEIIEINTADYPQYAPKPIVKHESDESKSELSARDRIKPRGLWGLYAGEIHYDHDEDIFNLGL